MRVINVIRNVSSMLMINTPQGEYVCTILQAEDSTLYTTSYPTFPDCVYNNRHVHNILSKTKNY